MNIWYCEPQETNITQSRIKSELEIIILIILAHGILEVKKNLILPHRNSSVNFITEISYRKIPINKLYSYKIGVYIYKIIVSQNVQRIFLVFFREIYYITIQIYILFMNMLLII